MADVVQAAPEAAPASARFHHIKFQGSYRNMVPGVSLILAGLLAPAMGLTDVFFAEALAWVFAIWGMSFIYVDLIDMFEVWELLDDGLVIKNPLRIWERNKSWLWSDIYRTEIVVERPDARIEDAELRVYYTPPGEGNIEREDRDYDPELARLIIDRAGLKPDGDTPADLAHFPEGVKASYNWNK